MQAALADHRRDGDARVFDTIIAWLLREYYDPMYDYAIERHRHRIQFTGDAPAMLDWLRGQTEEY